MRFSCGGDGAGAVVAVEVDPGRAAEVAEGVAERLDDALGAVGQFVQGAEVEVERRLRGGVAGEPAARGGRGLPVEVDVERAGGGALLGEGDGGGRLGEGDGGGAGGGRGGRWCGRGAGRGEEARGQAVGGGQFGGAARVSLADGAELPAALPPVQLTREEGGLRGGVAALVTGQFVVAAWRRSR